jgi:hypothetical protein
VPAGMLLAGKVNAGDGPLIWGSGARSCGIWVTYRRNNPDRAGQTFTWVQGYISGRLKEAKLTNGVLLPTLTQRDANLIR